MIHIRALGLQVRNMLGSGSFAQVYSCYDHCQGKQYAVKMIKKEIMTNSRVRAFFKQAEILEAMDHKNIVKFYSFHQTDQYLLIKMERIRGGTLTELIQKRKQARTPFKQQQIALFLKNLFEGIRYLHNLNIIHRDLKTENILFSDDNDLSTVKIVDFGLSAKLEIHWQKHVKMQCGTLLYMAPQMFNKPSYTKSIDIWSCAIIMFMMFNEGAHPFYQPGMKTEEFKHKLKVEHFPHLPYPLAQNFIDKISKKEYQERYNVNQALKHPWITRNKDDQIPLSIHQSFKGFDSTNEVITVLKLVLTIRQLVPHKHVQLDEFYRFKVNDFVSNNEAVRVYSPSRRRVRDKNNELYIRMKQIFHLQKPIKPQEIYLDHPEECSPTLKKHESVFMSLFDRQKSFQHMKFSENFELKKIQHEARQQKEEQILLFKYNTERPAIDHSLGLSLYLREEEESQLSNPPFIDKQLKRKVEYQIEESVNYHLKLYNRDQKRKIFNNKNNSIDDKEILGERRSKLMKKYSRNYEVEKRQEISKTINSSLPNKPIYTRKPMSPLKGQFTKPMMFNLSSRTHSLSSHGRK